METKKLKVLILGSAGHGKDTVAEILNRNIGLTFTSSSSFANSKFIFHQLKDKYNYTTEEECYNDRVNHRKEWYDLICEYNKEDRSKLTKDIISSYSVYVGMRDDAEFENSKHLFDIILWIDATNRIQFKDETLKIKREQADIIIDNNGTLKELENKIDRIGKLMQ